MQEGVKKIISILEKKYPNKIALDFKTPLQLLISTILSAQCTDVRVNIVTGDLFKEYKTAQDYANADLKKLEQIIRPTGFYKNKAKSIKNCCRIIVEDYNSRVPDSMEELTRLPGVGRKTANVVLSNAFGKNEGIVVDTHVRRLSGRIGLSKNLDPEKIELDLMKAVPKNDWHKISNLLIFHGRNTCKAAKPLCYECVIIKLCDFPKKTTRPF